MLKSIRTIRYYAKLRQCQVHVSLLFEEEEEEVERKLRIR